MVDRHEVGVRGAVEQGVEQRPVGDGIGAVPHPLGLTVRRCHRAGVQVVARERNRRRASRPSATAELTRRPSLVRCPCPSQPIRAGRPVNLTCWRALAIQSVTGCPEVLQDQVVDRGDVVGVPRERDPAEGADPLAEQRADIAFGKDAHLERIGDPGLEGLHA